MTAPRDREPGARPRRRVDVDDAHRMIEAHCRHAKTMIPRGVVGVEAAIEYLHQLPAACRRMLPDLTGSAPKFAGSAVHLGLLATTPSERVARSLPRLLASVSPVVVSRSPRIWTGWIARLLDADMQALLRERTPPSQLEVADLEPEPAISRRALKRRLGEIDGEVARLTAERDQLAADKSAVMNELESTRRRAADREAGAQSILAARSQTIAELQAERDALRSLRAEEEQRESDQRREMAKTLERLDRIELALPRLAAAEQEVARLTAANEELGERLARWERPTPMWLPAESEQRPGWYANLGGRALWIRAGLGRLGAYELRVEAPGEPVRSYGGLLGQLIIFVHLVHAGASEAEAGRISRISERACGGR